jgi:hypothetical protein
MTTSFHEFIVFVQCLFRYVRYVRAILVGLLLLILLGGLALSHLENLPPGDAIYFAFVTGMTIGYGDISPKTAEGRLVSVAVGLVGVVFTGLYVAIATRALADTHKRLTSDRR